METVISTEKKQRGFTLLEFIIILAIFNCITLIIVPVYQNSIKHKAWANTAAAVAPLKQTIAKCLHDNKGDVVACNDFSAAKLTKYGMPKAPAAASFFTTVTKNAAIRIVGADELGLCVAILTPTINTASEITEWRCTMQKQEKQGDSLQKCKQYLYGCYR